MTERNKIENTKDRAQKYLRLSIEHFRNCEDQLGLGMFLNFIDDLENILDLSQCLEEPQITKILPDIKTLYACLQNQDIAGMTDIMEFKIYPFLEGVW